MMYLQSPHFKAHKTKLAMMCVTKSDNEHLFVIFNKSDLLKFIFNISVVKFNTYLL